MSTTPAWTLTPVIKDPSCTSLPPQTRWLTTRQHNFHNKPDAMRRLGAASVEMGLRTVASKGFFGKSAVGADGVRRVWTEGA
ncbi:hypothetical protein IAQ61_007090 [Plenodomus lingam]|uniref:Predicted protein n=1 Tax=Leptosphaeria maculans (strain JN3 / isolate v23.1.3 / race Av1-4-5-6-7-8) TaxID=985895 RepID=E5A144_LEPMJ|nr:predicted protein [Plenodomus lingam JN3]KAH9867786.1 hypothetical protein IAQ61_007090 [Plenodomus lingam]CBX97500.1 predicted protein [Plenodomus lingam JN3]